MNISTAAFIFTFAFINAALFAWYSRKMDSIIKRYQAIINNDGVYIAELQQRLERQSDLSKSPVAVWLTMQPGVTCTIKNDGNDVHQIWNDNVSWTFLTNRN